MRTCWIQPAGSVTVSFQIPSASMGCFTVRNQSSRQTRVAPRHTRPARSDQAVRYGLTIVRCVCRLSHLLHQLGVPSLAPAFRRPARSSVIGIVDVPGHRTGPPGASLSSTSGGTRPHGDGYGCPTACRHADGARPVEHRRGSANVAPPVFVWERFLWLSALDSVAVETGVAAARRAGDGRRGRGLHRAPARRRRQRRFSRIGWNITRAFRGRVRPQPYPTALAAHGDSHRHRDDSHPLQTSPGGTGPAACRGRPAERGSRHRHSSAANDDTGFGGVRDQRTATAGP